MFHGSVKQSNKNNIKNLESAFLKNLSINQPSLQKLKISKKVA